MVPAALPHDEREEVLGKVAQALRMRARKLLSHRRLERRSEAPCNPVTKESNDDDVDDDGDGVNDDFDGDDDDRSQS